MDGSEPSRAFSFAFLSLLAAIALAAAGTGSALRAADLPAAPSAGSQPARSAPSGPRSAPGSSQAGDLPTPPAVSSLPAAGNSPAIEEWLNQTVRLPDTTQAFDKPSSDGRSLARIRAGAEIKAIGLVADKHWVQIELPDHSLAYVPRAAIEFENGPVAPSAPAVGQGGAPAGAEAAAPPPATSPPTAAAAPGVIHGSVTRVPNAATLVVGDQRLRLSGIDPGKQEALPPFENWVRGQGALTCEPDAQTGRYHCFTGGGLDVAEAAILNGAGRVGDGATPAYRESETQARTAKRGLWTEP